MRCNKFQCPPLYGQPHGIGSNNYSLVTNGPRSDGNCLSCTVPWLHADVIPSACERATCFKPAASEGRNVGLSPKKIKKQQQFLWVGVRHGARRLCGKRILKHEDVGGQAGSSDCSPNRNGLNSHCGETGRIWHETGSLCLRRPLVSQTRTKERT